MQNFWMVSVAPSGYFSGSACATLSALVIVKQTEMVIFSSAVLCEYSMERGGTQVATVPPSSNLEQPLPPVKCFSNENQLAIALQLLTFVFCTSLLVEVVTVMSLAYSRSVDKGVCGDQLLVAVFADNVFEADSDAARVHVELSPELLPEKLLKLSNSDDSLPLHVVDCSQTLLLMTLAERRAGAFVTLAPLDVASPAFDGEAIFG